MGDYDARGTYLGPELHNSPEIRFDAVRAVTHEHQSRPETPETLAEARLVLDMLGLLPEHRKRRGAGQLDVSCPQCQEPPGAPCKTEDGNRYRAGHVARHRRAQELREASS